MSAQKKRKAAPTASHSLSAFAARQKLCTEKRQDGGHETEPGPASDAVLRVETPVQEPSAQETDNRRPASTAGVSVETLSKGGHPASPPKSEIDVAGKKMATGQLALFRPNKKNCDRRTDGKIIVRLAAGERLVLLGSYGLTLRSGKVNVVGAALTSDDGTSWVHSPQCLALPVIRAPEDTVLELQPHPSAAGLRQLDRLSRVFSKLWSLNEGATGSNDAFEIVSSLDRVIERPAQLLAVPPEWNKTIAMLDEHRPRSQSVVLVTGPKSSGKSTFSKMLANRLITARGSGNVVAQPGVAVLDLDPGQSEYAPPGTLSLVYLTRPNLSPPFCHPVVPGGSAKGQILRSHAVAAISSSQDSGHYNECALDLLAEYHRRLRNRCPLIVNTAGWVQGTGLDTLCELVRRVRPTQVLYMSEDGPLETVESLTNACEGIAALSTLPSQPSEYTSRTSQHFRTMQTMSYFHVEPVSRSAPLLRWAPKPLTEVPPWLVRYAGSNRGVRGIIFYDYSPPAELVAEALNGMIAALVRIEDRAAFRSNISKDASSGELPTDDSEDVVMHDGDNLDPTTPNPGALPKEDNKIMISPEGIPVILLGDGGTLDPKHSKFIDLVLIRGIDAEGKQLQLLTPMTESTLADVQKAPLDHVLVAGKFDTPTWAFTEDLFRQGQSKDSALSKELDAEVSVLAEEDTDEDEETAAAAAQGQSNLTRLRGTENPWVDVLQGNEKRAVGSRIWRVRRDLSRQDNAV